MSKRSSNGENQSSPINHFQNSILIIEKFKHIFNYAQNMAWKKSDWLQKSIRLK